MKKHEDGRLWVHTGDIGNIDKDGFITLVGRIKRVIVTFENGIYHKVFPKLLEDEFLKINGIQTIAIVGKQVFVDSNVNELVAFVVLEQDAIENTILETLHRFENENLESYEKPCRYIFVDRLPRTTIGKIDYRQLEKEASNI